MEVPYFRPSISDAEIGEVVHSLKSGWLTTGPKVKQFEADVAALIGCRHAVALNSCTGALHLALEALGVKAGDLVLVPTMTFAATAEVVRYFDAVPVFVDCGDDFCISAPAVEETIAKLLAAEPVAGLKPPYGAVRAIIPMHYGGCVCDMRTLQRIVARHDIPVVEDAAHAFLSQYRPTPGDAWEYAGRLSRVGCFSFYANKCITTGEGGMAVTDDDELADRMRVMSLHGMDRDAWKRYTGQGSWFYKIVAPGFKYNLTDLAAAIGIHQLKRAEEFRGRREAIAARYTEAFAAEAALQTPAYDPATRIHSWHLYPLLLNLERLTIDRAGFIEELRRRGVNCSMHWMPLHLQPYYRDTYGLGERLFPVAEALWVRQISLPIFPDIREEEMEHVMESVVATARKHAK